MTSLSLHCATHIVDRPSTVSRPSRHTRTQPSDTSASSLRVYGLSDRRRPACDLDLPFQDFTEREYSPSKLHSPLTIFAAIQSPHRECYHYPWRRVFSMRWLRRAVPTINLGQTDAMIQNYPLARRSLVPRRKSDIRIRTSSTHIDLRWRRQHVFQAYTLRHDICRPNPYHESEIFFRPFTRCGSRCPEC